MEYSRLNWWKWFHLLPSTEPSGGIEDACLKLILLCVCIHFYRDVLHNEPSLFLCLYTWNFKRFVWYFNICTKYFTMYLVRNDLINECNQSISSPHLTCTKSKAGGFKFHSNLKKFKPNSCDPDRIFGKTPTAMWMKAVKFYNCICN